MKQPTNRKPLSAYLAQSKPSKAIKPTNKGPLYTAALREKLAQVRPK
jgi:hypothetical protein